VSRGADIERRDVNLMSPLMWAATEGHADVVKVLIKAGACFWYSSFCFCVSITPFWWDKYIYFLPPSKEVMFSPVSVCLSVCYSTRNSAVADKPRDAYVQYAMAWLTPSHTLLPICVTRAVASLEEVEGTSIWRVGIGDVGSRKCLPSRRGVRRPWPPEFLLYFIIFHSDAFFGSENGHCQDCWGGCQKRPEGPKIEAEGREREWGSWGGAASPPPHQLGSLEERCELPQRGSGQSHDHPKVFHYFQHSGWPPLTLYNIVNCGSQKNETFLSYSLLSQLCALDDAIWCF